MSRPKNCRLCGTPLSKNKRPDSQYCNTYHRLIANKLKRGIISTFHAQKLMDEYNIKRTKIEVLQQ